MMAGDLEKTREELRMALAQMMVGSYQNKIKEMPLPDSPRTGYQTKSEDCNEPIFDPSDFSNPITPPTEEKKTIIKIPCTHCGKDYVRKKCLIKHMETC